MPPPASTLPLFETDIDRGGHDNIGQQRTGRGLCSINFHLWFLFNYYTTRCLFRAAWAAPITDWGTGNTLSKPSNVPVSAPIIHSHDTPRQLRKPTPLPNGESLAFNSTTILIFLFIIITCSSTSARTTPPLYYDNSSSNTGLRQHVFPTRTLHPAHPRAH